MSENPFSAFYMYHWEMVKDWQIFTFEVPSLYGAGEKILFPCVQIIYNFKK